MGSFHVSYSHHRYLQAEWQTCSKCRKKWLLLLSYFSAGNPFQGCRVALAILGRFSKVRPIKTYLMVLCKNITLNRHQIPASALKNYMYTGLARLLKEHWLRGVLIIRSERNCFCLFVFDPCVRVERWVYHLLVTVSHPSGKFFRDLYLAGECKYRIQYLL